MVHKPKQFDPKAPIVAIDIGNTTMAVATWHQGTIRTPLYLPTGDDEAFRKALAAHFEACTTGRPSAVVVCSVVPPVSGRVSGIVSELFEQNILVVGDTIALPIEIGVQNAKALGVDRVCAAAAAYYKIQSACAIIDFGTAVTVDVVDNDGILLGGAILPGIDLQFRALHDHTAALPLVAKAVPERLFGRDTEEAIQTGVCRGLAGAVRGLVEGYATELNQWPQVVATGGDAEFMAPLLDFADTLVSDLTLRGVGLAYDKHLSEMGV